MSEFTNTIEQRAKILSDFMYELIEKGNGSELVKKYRILEIRFIPKDILPAFDYLFEREKDIEKIRVVSNKIFNLLYKTLSSYPSLPLPQRSLLELLAKDNAEMKKFLQENKKLIKDLNKMPYDEQLRERLSQRFEQLLGFYRHYEVLQNVLFPVLEQKWKYNKCLQLLWYIQDKVRDDIKKTLGLLSDKDFDISEFNRVSSVIYFDMYTLAFREEKVLFPVILETIDSDEIALWLNQAQEIGLGFVTIDVKEHEKQSGVYGEWQIVLPTGKLSVEQLMLIFNHLPVDLTFVDENDEVKFFSTPKERIFPRTKAIIGRKVQNCHPPDSVDVVNKILEAFKSGRRDVAKFWIQLRDGRFVFIQYFAVRDEQGQYKGTLEVTQEVSEIRGLEGERRLLDWE